MLPIYMYAVIKVVKMLIVHLIDFNYICAQTKHVYLQNRKLSIEVKLIQTFHILIMYRQSIYCFDNEHWCS